MKTQLKWLAFAFVLGATPVVAMGLADYAWANFYNAMYEDDE